MPWYMGQTRPIKLDVARFAYFANSIRFMNSGLRFFRLTSSFSLLLRLLMIQRLRPLSRTMAHPLSKIGSILIDPFSFRANVTQVGQPPKGRAASLSSFKVFGHPYPVSLDSCITEHLPLSGDVGQLVLGPAKFPTTGAHQKLLVVPCYLLISRGSSGGRYFSLSFSQGCIVASFTLRSHGASVCLSLYVSAASLRPCSSSIYSIETEVGLF
jgi:hypothetical protein